MDKKKKIVPQADNTGTESGKTGPDPSEETISLEGFRLVHLETASMLYERRVILGMSQLQVAQKAKITQQQYQRFESGKRNLQTSSFQIACRVLEALDMDIVKFFHGKYTIGEEIYVGDDHNLRYKKTGKRIDEDVVDDPPAEHSKNDDEHDCKGDK